MGRNNRRAKMEEDPREARRKRILNRGNDRIAFITGQTRSLHLPEDAAPTSPTPPPLPPSPKLRQGISPRAPYGLSSPRIGTIGFHVNNSGLRIQDVNSTSVDKKREAGTGVSEIHLNNGIFNHERENGSKLYETEKGAETKENRSELEPQRVGTPISQRPYNQGADNSAMPCKKKAIFSSKQITDSILASENARAICAIGIGLLAVLFYHVQSLGGEFLRSIFNFRPLLLVLMTDVTIVLAKLIASGGADAIESVKEKTKRKNDDWTDNLGKTLEVSIVVKKAMTAISMDFSICAVILVCGVGI